MAKPASTGSHEGILAVYNKSGSLILMTLAKGFVAVLKADAFRFVDLVKVCYSYLINAPLSRLFVVILYCTSSSLFHVDLYFITMGGISIPAFNNVFCRYQGM